LRPPTQKYHAQRIHLKLSSLCDLSFFKPGLAPWAIRKLRDHLCRCVDDPHHCS
jgi:hypothetical protein